ncbi:hypothetical protein [Larkinella terrae]|uniref:Uncharacterized protein n=1 Tax=Larkinella terrae TaxID=2025311 RepID=A0A7K0EDX4_9BACT|nr:hypothetical protein [Larkinella terrae]MRS60027.1 hypothetical protein [Larkinella terrae]
MAIITKIYNQLQHQFQQGSGFGPANRLIQNVEQNSAGEITVVFNGLLLLLEEVGGRIIVKIPGGVRSVNNDLPADLGELCDHFITLVKAEAGNVPVDEMLV